MGWMFKGGVKNKPCKVSPNKLHEWTTMESMVDGRHLKMTVCKHCGHQP